MLEHCLRGLPQTSREQEGELISPDCHGLLHQVPEVYTLHIQEALMVTDALAANFCHLGILRN
jgi:hypothetical protein